MKKRISLVRKPVILLKTRYVLIASVILLILFLFPYIAFSPDNMGILFNQHYIETLDNRYNAASFNEKFHTSVSYYTLALNELFDGRKSASVAFDDPDTVFEYVWNNLPYYAIVYPTEMYYYYQLYIVLIELQLLLLLTLIYQLSYQLSPVYLHICS